ncbi:hypothetical protein GKQ38_02645 [Candidatus Nanohaloarchaea archaeon]|nr:hypothetical protein GKQ38_02645 [Candidatus Nanohaloarchaea archaeon]
MSDVSFSTALTTELRTRLDGNFEVIPEYESASSSLDRVHDLVILEEGQIRLIFELEGGTDGFEDAKQELRKFYEKESGDEVFLLAVCSKEELLVFDAENEIYSQQYTDDPVEKIAEDVVDLLE